MKKLIINCLFLLFAIPSTGQITDFNFLYYRENEGLADNQIYDFQEDFQGRIWIATQLGVSRFDGKNFKNYIHQLEDSEIWQNWNGCHFLTLDNHGRIWEATTRQLFYFDEKLDKFIEYDLSAVEPESSLKNWKNNIYLQDWKDERSVWFRKGTGIYAINCDDLICRRKLTIPIEYRSVWGVLGKDLLGNIAVGNANTNAITFFNPTGSQFTSNIAPSNMYMMFQQAGSNQIWVGGEQLMSYDKNDGKWESWNTSTGTRNLSGITTIPALTGDSVLWMYGFYGTSVLCFNMRQKRFVEVFSTERFDKNGLRCGLIRAMFVDSKSNIWLGGDAGVSILFGSQEQFEKYITGCPKGTTQGQISTKSKPELFAGGTWKMPDGSLAEWVADGEKIYYVALSDHSKAYFEGKRMEDGISGRCKFVDLQTGQRIIKQLNYHKNAQGDWLESNSNTTFDEVEQPLQYWPSTNNKIKILRGEKFGIEKDVSGSWIGHGSLCYYFQDSDSVVYVQPTHIFHGLKIKTDLVEGIQVRWYGGCRTEMWISFKIVTPDSLSHFFKMMDSNCEYTKGETGQGGTKRSRWKGSKDSIFIHTFRIFDKIQPLNPVDYQQKTFELDHVQNFISFEFDCANPTYPLLWYKLEGFDQDWFQTRSNKIANYTNLDGGDYTFRVKAQNENGLEMGPMTTFRLYVIPPYYRTWWFYGLCILLIGIIFYSIFKNREIQRLHQEQFRLLIARDLHDEVGSTLSTISILSESTLLGVQKDLDQARFYNIGDKARNALESISDIVWSINPKNDSMAMVLARMSAFASEILEGVGSELHFMSNEDVESLTIPMGKRKDFYLLFKEAINNCAKHAHAKHVEVKLEKQGNTLMLHVKDDGVGFNIQNEQSGVTNLGGNGLQNMYSRAKVMGADLKVNSATGAGTELILKVPIST